MLEDELFNCIWIYLEGLLIGQIDVILVIIVICLCYLFFKVYIVNVIYGDYSGIDFEGSNFKVYMLEYLELQ